MSFRIGVIGCGWVSTACHGPSYQEYASQHPDFELAACCDTDLLRAEAFRARFGFRQSYTNYQEMLASAPLDAVCLNVPPRLTCEIGCAVLRAKIPLLAEKPPGITAGELDLLIKTARLNNVPHQVAFNRRFAPLAGELKRRLAGWTIHHIDYSLVRVGRINEDFSTTAIHAIDTTRFLASSDYNQVHIHYQEIQNQAPGAFLNYQLDGLFTNGASFHITVCPSGGVALERAAVYTDDRAFFLSNNIGPDAPGGLQCYEKGQLTDGLNAAEFCGRQEEYYLNGFYQEDAAFFDFIQEGTPPTEDFRSAEQSVAIMQALREKQTTFLKQ